MSEQSQEQNQKQQLSPIIANIDIFNKQQFHNDNINSLKENINSAYDQRYKDDNKQEDDDDVYDQFVNSYEDDIENSSSNSNDNNQLKTNDKEDNNQGITISQDSIQIDHDNHNQKLEGNDISTVDNQLAQDNKKQQQQLIDDRKSQSDNDSDANNNLNDSDNEREDFDEDIYGDEIIDLGTDIQPFSMSTLSIGHDQKQRNTYQDNDLEEVSQNNLAPNQKEEDEQNDQFNDKLSEKEDDRSEDERDDLGDSLEQKQLGLIPGVNNNLQQMDDEFSKLFGLNNDQIQHIDIIKPEEKQQVNYDQEIEVKKLQNVSDKEEEDDNDRDDDEFDNDQNTIQQQQPLLDFDEFDDNDKRKTNRNNKFDDDADQIPINPYEMDDSDPYANSMMFKSFKIPKNIGAQLGQMNLNAKNTANTNIFGVIPKSDQKDEDEIDIVDDRSDDDDEFANDRDDSDDDNMRQDDDGGEDMMNSQKDDNSKINVFLNNYNNMQLNLRKYTDEDIKSKSAKKRAKKYSQFSDDEEEEDKDDKDHMQVNGLKVEESEQIESNQVDLLTKEQFDKKLQNKMEEEEVPLPKYNKMTSFEMKLQSQLSSQSDTLKNGLGSFKGGLMSFDNEVQIDIVDDNSDYYEEDDFEKDEEDDKLDKEEDKQEGQDDIDKGDDDLSDGYNQRGKAKNQIIESCDHQESYLTHQQDSQENTDNQNAQTEEIKQHESDEDLIDDRDLDESLDDLNSDKDKNYEVDDPVEDVTYDQQMFSRFSSTFKFNPGQFKEFKTDSSNLIPQSNQDEQAMLKNRNQITYGSDNPFQDVDKFDFDEFQPIQDDTFDDGFDFSKDDNDEPKQIRKSPYKDKKQQDTGNMNVQNDKVKMSDRFDNLALVKGGANQDIDIRRGLTVEKYFDTQKQVEVRQQKSDNNYTDKEIPELIINKDVEIIKQTKHDKFFEKKTQDDDNFDEDQDDQEVQRLKQQRLKIGRPVEKKAKGTDQDNDEDSDDSDLDRDDDATRDNDLDELFGFESQAKKQQKLKENEEPDDGRTRLVINSDQDWLTGVKYEGWKIIDGARPDGEISEKCQENVQPLISKKLISKRLNLIMENIFNNLMKGKITEVAQPKKHGKQVKAKYAHSQFDIEFGKQLLEEIININVSQPNYETYTSKNDFQGYQKEVQGRSEITKSKLKNLLQIKKPSISLPLIPTRIYECIKYPSISQDIIYEEKSLECNEKINDIQQQEEMQLNVVNKQLSYDQDEEHIKLPLKRQSSDYDKFFQVKSQVNNHINLEIKEEQKQKFPPNQQQFQDEMSRIQSNQSIQSYQSENHQIYNNNELNTESVIPFEVSFEHQNNRSISQTSNMNNLNSNSSKKLRISRKSIQFINHVSKDVKSRISQLNQDALPQRSVSLIYAANLSDSNTATPTLTQKQSITSSNQNTPNMLQTPVMQGHTQSTPLQQPSSFQSILRQNSKLSSVLSQGQTVLGKKFPVNMIKIKLANGGAKNNQLKILNTQNNTKEESKRGGSIVIKSISKSIQSRIKDINAVDPKLLKIKQSILASGFNTKSPVTSSSNSQSTLAQMGVIEQVGSQAFQDVKKLIMSKTRQKVDLYNSEIKSSSGISTTSNIQQKAQKVISEQNSTGQIQISRFSNLKPIQKLNINRMSEVNFKIKKPLVVTDFDTSQQQEELQIKEQKSSEDMPFGHFKDSRSPAQINRHSEKTRNLIYTNLNDSESLDEIKLPDNQYQSFGSNDSSTQSQQKEFKNSIFSHNQLQNQKGGLIAQLSPQSHSKPIKLKGNDFQTEEIIKQMKEQTPQKSHHLHKHPKQIEDKSQKKKEDKIEEAHPGFNQDYNRTSSQVFRDIDENTSHTNIRKVYKFSKTIGGGFFGIVRLATLVSDESENPIQYAVKSITRQSLGREAALLEQEIQNMKESDHPNIAKLYEVYSDQNYIHLVSEFCEGKELLHLLRRDKIIEERKACSIMRQMLAAVRYLHEKQICHRDIKPENFLISELEDGLVIVKLIDFGFSKRFSKDTENLEMHALLGTPNYIAPEILSGQYDFKCDIWSLGIILHLMLMGSYPFETQIENLKQRFDRMVKQFNYESYKHLSDSPKNLLSYMLTVDPQSRFSVQECQEHEWFNQQSEEISINKEDIEYFIEKHIQKLEINNIQREVFSFISRNLNDQKLFQKMNDAFKLIDQDQSGLISKQEIHNFFENSDFKLSQDQILNLVNSFQFDENNLVNYTTFCTTAIDYETFLDDQNLQFAFHHYDTQNQGFITLESLVECFKREGRDYDIDNLKQVIEKADLDKNGVISFEEFKILMKNL
eukprot:403364539